MKVLKGFSEEVTSMNWVKGDVELDSTDLKDLAVEHGFSLDDLTLAQKYGILSSEAEKLLTVEYIRAIQLRAPGSRDMDHLKKRLAAVTEIAANNIASAKRVSSGGNREENS